MTGFVADQTRLVKDMPEPKTEAEKAEYVKKLPEEKKKNDEIWAKLKENIEDRCNMMGYAGIF